MLELAVLGGLAALVFVFISAGIHFGSKWIDKVLCVPPPLDPNKPIVRRSPQGTSEVGQDG